MLRDSHPIDIDAFARRYFGRGKKNKESALEWLRELSEESFTSDQLFNVDSAFSEAEPAVYCDRKGQWWTNRYIGHLSFNGKTVVIEPRFGINEVLKLLSLESYKPVFSNSEIGSGKSGMQLFQAMLWLKKLIKAAKHAAPVSNVQQSIESPIVRGKLDVRGTVRARAKSPNKLVSKSSVKVALNPISIAVAKGFWEIQSWFPNHDLMHWLPVAVGQRMEQISYAVPRSANIPSFRDVSRTRTSIISQGYKDLAKDSLRLILHRRLEEKLGRDASTSFLVDVAELWEQYVLEVLRAALENSPLNVEHGTLTGGDYLLRSDNQNHRLGKLLPDYLIKSVDGEVVYVADAKYKRLGDAPWQSPKRDDLYQITSYLSKYGNSKLGILFYPSYTDGEFSDVENQGPWHLANEQQQIQFISLPLDKVSASLKVQGLLRTFWERPPNA